MVRHAKLTVIASLAVVALTLPVYTSSSAPIHAALAPRVRCCTCHPAVQPGMSGG